MIMNDDIITPQVLHILPLNFTEIFSLPSHIGFYINTDPPEFKDRTYTHWLSLVTLMYFYTYVGWRRIMKVDLKYVFVL